MPEKMVSDTSFADTRFPTAGSGSADFAGASRALESRLEDKAARSIPMTEKYVFADVDLPFHVWVREGGRWVLREAAGHITESAAPARADSTPPVSQQSSLGP
jgi:hypothetical protein